MASLTGLMIVACSGDDASTASNVVGDAGTSEVGPGGWPDGAPADGAPADGAPTDAAGCSAVELNCGDSVDNDCNGATDCDDVQCSAQVCAVDKTCQNGKCTCNASTEQCSDGKDNDCDGKTDCEDSGCDGKSCASNRTCSRGRCVWKGFNCEDCPWGWGQIKGKCWDKFACYAPGKRGAWFHSGKWNEEADCAACNSGGGLDWEIWEP